MKLTNSRRSTYFLVAVAIFGAIAIILYTVPIFSFNIPIFPSFLSVHLDEIPAFIVGYAYGPWAALFVIVIKTFPKLFFTSTMTVGEFCDLILSLAFVLPAAFLFKYKRSPKWVVIGLAISFVSQLITAMLVTTFVVLPIYMFVFKMSEDQLLGMIRAVVPNVTNLQTGYMFFVALPFNAIKNGIVVTIVSIVFFPLLPTIKKVRSQNGI